MAYTKNVWVDQNVQRPKTYEVTNNADGSVTLTDSFGVVTELGTPVNAVNMNHIEDGIADNDTAITTINGKIPSNASSSNKMAVASDIAAINTALTLKADKTQLHALKGYSDNGELLTDAEGLADVKTYAHSTFDLSKFTVVGSPKITDDGIASGFSSGNYIYVNNITNLGTKPFKIITNFNYEGSETVLWQISGGGWSNYLKANSTDNIILYMAVGSSSEVVKNFSIDNKLVAGNNYTHIFEFTGAKYKFDLYQNDELLGSDSYNSTSSIYPNTTTQIDVGISTYNGYLVSGSIDLKQFSITVDGVEVFNGNRTGIDTIKPDDYTVVGTPTISVDGVASGFAEENNYVYKTLNLSNTSSLRIEFANIYCPRQTTGRNKTFFEIQPTSNSSYFGLRLFRNAAIDGGLGAVYPTSSGSATSVNLNPSFSAARNFSGYIEIKNNILNFVINNTACGSYELTTEQLAYIFTNVNLSIGASTHPSSQQYLVDGSIDLNAFKIYVDGNLVYQPCLKIPYTESKTGSKIVQSIYRDRVSDMAEQFGYANYYTLDEDNGNFTLPQVELYGYIEKRARDIAHPVAHPFYRFSDEINEDEVRLEGAEVDKGLYLAIEQDPYLSALCTAGSTADKICLPDFRNRVIYGDVASGYVEPELPNITGYFQIGDGCCVNDSSGVFSRTTNRGNAASGNWYDSNTCRGDFDASRSSSIYKEGGTVKTAGVKARWLCRWK